MPPELVLAIDLGSSWCKAAYLDQHGAIVAEGRAFSRTITDDTDTMLERFWGAVIEAVRQAGDGLSQAPGPGAVALSCRGLFGICLDQAGEAFIPSLNILSIKRSPEAAAAFRAPVWGEEGPYAYGYAVRLAGLLAAMRQRSPDEWRRIDRVGALHTFITYRLSGSWVTDPTTGPGGLEWPEGVMQLSGLPLAAFPVIQEPWLIAGGLTNEAAEALDLPAGTPVVTGLHDGAAANIGTGAIQPGDACLTLGSNFAVRVVTGDRPRTDCFGYVVAPDRWAWVNSVPGVAAQLDLVATALVTSLTELRAKHHRLAELAAAVANNTLLPTLPFGEDAALLDAVSVARQRGHTAGEIYLAALHAAANGSLGLVEKAGRDGAPSARFVATGGGACNRLLLRVLAETLGQSIEVGHSEAGLLGVGMVAAVGAGWYKTLDHAAKAMTPPTSTVDFMTGASAAGSGKVLR